MIRAIGAAVAVAALAGCAAPVQPQVVTRTVYVQPHVPPDLLTCMAAPAVPAPSSQAVVARFIVADRAAGHDCRVRLGAVRSLLATKPR